VGSAAAANMAAAVGYSPRWAEAAAPRRRPMGAPPNPMRVVRAARHLGPTMPPPMRLELELYAGSIKVHVGSAQVRASTLATALP